MKLTWQPITLDLKTTFRIAHGASDQRHNVITAFSHGDFNGMGEAAGVPHLGESQEIILTYLSALKDSAANPELYSDPFQIEKYTNLLPAGSQSARAAIDIALHDLWGQLLNQPLYRVFGLDPANIPETSLTIAIDDPGQMAMRAAESGWPILKIKVGGNEDEATVAAIRQVTSARLRMDANAGWNREQAKKMIPRLAAYGIEFIEQPLPAKDLDGLRWLRQQHLGVPIFADESVKTAHDVAALAGVVDGVVIKLMKTGGLREALRAIHTARSLDMQVMLSCMVESSLGVTAAAHIAPLSDFVDLDGPLLIKNDPFVGVKFHGAQLILPDLPGLGVRMKAKDD